MKRHYRTIVSVVIIAVIVNVLARHFNVILDLTIDKKYSFDARARTIVETAKSDVTITSFLTGEVPPSFREYKDYIDYYLARLVRINPNINVVYKDISSGSLEEQREAQQYLSSYGARPIRRTERGDGQKTEEFIYPYISVFNESRAIFIDLFEPKSPEQSEEEALLNSQLRFQYKLLRALRDIDDNSSGIIAVMGAENRMVAAGLNSAIRRTGNYFYFPMSAEQVLSQSDTIQSLIVTVRSQDLSHIELLALDQFLLSEKPVLCFVDEYAVSEDSIQKYGIYPLVPPGLSVSDYLFHHGVKLTSEIVLSPQSASIQQVIGQEGGQPQIEMKEFHYHIHGDDRINTQSDMVLLPFTTAITTFKNEDIDMILQTFGGAVTKGTNSVLSFDNIQSEFVDENSDSAVPIAVGVHRKGAANSYFKHRLHENDRKLMAHSGKTFQAGADSISLVVVSDVDMLLPRVAADGSLLPIGYHKWERKVYEGNIDFLSNTLELVNHGNLLLGMSGRKYTQAIFDRDKFDRSRMKTYGVVFVVPLLILGFVALSVSIYRHQKYAS